MASGVTRSHISLLLPRFWYNRGLRRSKFKKNSETNGVLECVPSSQTSTPNLNHLHKITKPEAVKPDSCSESRSVFNHTQICEFLFNHTQFGGICWARFRRSLRWGKRDGGGVHDVVAGCEEDVRGLQQGAPRGVWRARRVASQGVSPGCEGVGGWGGGAAVGVREGEVHGGLEELVELNESCLDCGGSCKIVVDGVEKQRCPASRMKKKEISPCDFKVSAQIEERKIWV